jgi:hypothetical protein
MSKNRSDDIKVPDNYKPAKNIGADPDEQDCQ